MLVGWFFLGFFFWFVFCVLFFFLVKGGCGEWRMTCECGVCDVQKLPALFWLGWVLSFLLSLLACWPDSSDHGGTDNRGTDVIPGSLGHNCFKQ